MNFKNSTNHL